MIKCRLTEITSWFSRWYRRRDSDFKKILMMGPKWKYEYDQSYTSWKPFWVLLHVCTLQTFARPSLQQGFIQLVPALVLARTHFISIGPIFATLHNCNLLHTSSCGKYLILHSHYHFKKFINFCNLNWSASNICRIQLQNAINNPNFTEWDN